MADVDTGMKVFGVYEHGYFPELVMGVITGVGGSYITLENSIGIVYQLEKHRAFPFTMEGKVMAMTTLHSVISGLDV